MTENMGTGERQTQEKNTFQARHILLDYLYTGDKDRLEKLESTAKEQDWPKWRRAVLVETEQAFFDSAGQQVDDELKKELRRNYDYINLNVNQTLLLFTDRNCDYHLIANQICNILRRRYSVRFYLSLSRSFEGLACMPEILKQLEQRMEEKFYHKDNRVFYSEEDELDSVGKEVQDAQLVQLISEDISRKDTEQLRRHFECLKEKYGKNTTFSAMYVKFVFSNVIQEIFQESHFFDENILEREIDLLYSCNSIGQILNVTENVIEGYERFLEESVKASGKEVRKAETYVKEHYAEDITTERLSEETGLPCGYLSFLFKKETGCSIQRYLHVQRMENAKELLKNSAGSIKEIGKKVGFAEEEYFQTCWLDYFGYAP